MDPGEAPGTEIQSPVRGVIFKHLLFRARRKRDEYRHGCRYLYSCLSFEFRKFMPSPFRKTRPSSEKLMGEMKIGVGESWVFGVSVVGVGIVTNWDR